MRKCRSVLSASVILGAVSILPAAADTPADTMLMARGISAISTFDPAQIGEVVTSEIILNTCDTLVENIPDAASEVRPALATAWSMAEDGSALTFKIREGVTFPSGNPMTAADIAWSMQRVLKLDFGNAATLKEYGFTKDNAEAYITAPDATTLVLKLAKPYPIQLMLQAIGANGVSSALDQTLVMANAVDGDMGNKYLTTNTACVGPYSLKAWNAGEAVILEANEGYYGAPPKMKRWIIRHVAEAGSQRLLLEKGDIDVARDLGAENMKDMAGNADIAVERALKHQTFYMGFNNGMPEFADDRVRLAFRYLFDYQGLADSVMAFDGFPRATVVPYGAYGAIDKAEGQPFSLDLDKAKALLAEAGFADGFKARLFIGSSAAYAPAIAQHVQANAAKIGVTLEIEQMADAQLFSAFRGREFDTVMLSWSTNVPHAHGMLSRQAVNPDNSLEAKLGMYPTWRGAWYRTEFNERVEAALFERDPDKQKAMYRQIQLDLLEQGPYAYLFQLYDTAGVRTTVKGWTWNAFRIYYDEIGK